MHSCVEKQLAAYNKRDLETYVSCFHEDIEVYLFPQSTLLPLELSSSVRGISKVLVKVRIFTVS